MDDKYGPIFSIRLGLRPVIVVSNWEFAKELYTTHDSAVASCPQMLAGKHLGYNYPMFGLSPYGAHQKVMKETSKEYDNLLEVWLEEHRDRRKGHTHSGSADRDFIDVMISKLKDVNKDNYDADTINKSTCLNLNLAGVDTTATMLTWTISLLMNHRNVLMEVEEELDIHVGKERIVEESDIPKLVYLQAVIKESLRLYPPVPLGGPREVTQDCVVGGYISCGGRDKTFL
ncbi:cytochrome P450 82A3-like [Impatiens glandulifera]|uniref:cytochrome P450 82A3-like n=1 Tax=Impatiens glandulifera TaxID=253017 RepID=UPI001FB0C7E1|nr:cytochrome P450 82A3-like [Impatiens glandulifera]